MPLCRSSLVGLLTAVATIVVGSSYASQRTERIDDERIDEEHPDKMRGLPGFNQPLPVSGLHLHHLSLL